VILKPSHIIIHNSDTKDSGTVSWGAIRKYHKGLGWNDIGYHFGIEDINGHPEILMGRLPNIYGAHCRQQGMNRKSIGICVVGCFDTKQPSDVIWDTLVSLTKWLVYIYDINVTNVCGHRKYATHKTCPGRMFDMGRLRADILCK